MSIRYMRMKPRIRERPIQAWGVRGWDSGWDEDNVAGGESRMWISLGELGVWGGEAVGLVLISRPAGMTGPGRAWNGSVSSAFRSLRWVDWWDS